MLGDEFLTQDELNSLLNGLNSDEVKQPDNNPLLDMMGEIGNIAMGAGSTTMSTLLRKKVNITSPDASIIKFKDIKTKFSGQQLVITINYKKGLEGLNTFVMPARIAQIIADLMMGGNGDLPAEVQLDELGMSAAGEAMNQMMGSAATAMAEFIKTPVDITPPTVSIHDFDNGDTKFPPIESNDEAEIICIKFSMEIKEIATTTVWQFIPMHFAKHIESLMKGPETPAVQPPPAKTQQIPVQQPVQQIPVQQPQQQYQPQPQYYNVPVQQPMYQVPQGFSNPNIMQGSEVKVNPVNFGPLTGQPSPATESIDLSKLQLLMDVPLELTVELGRVKMSLREILQLYEGSMVQLDKLAGEPLDVYINGRLIARGEVVVIEESFGIRIIEIVSLEERIRTIK